MAVKTVAGKKIRRALPLGVQVPPSAPSFFHVPNGTAGQDEPNWRLPLLAKAWPEQARPVALSSRTGAAIASLLPHGQLKLSLHGNAALYHSQGTT
jgi:hypothetical protein